MGKGCGRERRGEKRRGRLGGRKGESYDFLLFLSFLRQNESCSMKVK